MNEPPAKLDTTVQIKPTAHSCGERGIRVINTTAATKPTAKVTMIAIPYNFSSAVKPLVETGSMPFTPELGNKKAPEWGAIELNKFKLQKYSE